MHVGKCQLIWKSEDGLVDFKEVVKGSAPGREDALGTLRIGEQGRRQLHACHAEGDHQQLFHLWGKVEK